MCVSYQNGFKVQPLISLPSSWGVSGYCTLLPFFMISFFSCCLSEYLLASFTAAWVGTLLATRRGDDRGLVEAGQMPCRMWLWFCLGGGQGGCKGRWMSCLGLGGGFYESFFSLMDLLL